MNATTTLTGGLPFVIVTAAILGFPLSLLLLSAYRRSVLNVMNSFARVGPATPGTAQLADPPPAQGSGAISLVDVTAAPVLPASGSRDAPLLRAWGAAAVYAGAGTAYAAVMAAGWLVATEDPDPSWMKASFLFWTYFWPAAITVALVAVVGRRERALLFAAYFAVWAALASVALARSPSLRVGDLPRHWIIEAGVPSILLLAFLWRSVRAVGPMVLAFLVVCVIGSQAVLSLADSNPGVLSFIGRVGFGLGLGATGVFVGMIVVGLLAFAAIGWVLLRVLARRYQAKKLSDESLTIDSIWLVFGVVQSIGLAFEGLLWIATGIAAFVVYKVVALSGFRWVGRIDAAAKPRMLLLLRVFALGRRSEDLVRALRKLWGRSGSIALIAGPDVATAIIDPSEFLAFVGGALRRQFVQSPEDLERRIAQLDLLPDPDRTYRVNEFFCHTDTWQITMHTLARLSDSVLMDLRSFSPANRGCQYELGELLQSVSLDRVVLVVDAKTDRSFLESTMRRLAGGVAPGSPNFRAARTARLFAIEKQSGSEIRALFRLLTAGGEPSVRLGATMGESP